MRALVAATMCPLEFLVSPPSIEEKFREKPNQGLRIYLISTILPEVDLSFGLSCLRSSWLTPSITSSLVAALIASSSNLHISRRLDWILNHCWSNFIWFQLTVTHFSLKVVTRLQYMSSGKVSRNFKRALIRFMVLEISSSYKEPAWFPPCFSDLFRTVPGLSHC